MCKEWLPPDSFYKNKSRKNGLHTNCKNCEAARYHRIKNTETYKKRVSKTKKKYRSKKETKEKIRQYSKKHWEKIKVDPNYKNKRKEYLKEKRKTDVNFKLRITYRRRFQKIMKGKYREQTTMAYIGCSLDDFRIYMESKFQEGMTWSNHGFTGWHVDHIIPCAKFDLTKEEEVRKCFHYTNLQPLWAEDNLRKSDSIIL